MKRLMVLLISLSLLGAAATARAAGALAIDNNRGSAYGFSHDYANMGDAERRALSECGRNCRVVLRFQTGCGAYAADQSSGSSVYGWGTASSRDAAQNRAREECRRAGGRNCVLRAWACNAR